MRVLALDTSTWTCAVALMRAGVVRAERCERTTSSHAGTLPRVVDAVLAAAGERLEAGDAVAVSIGPGSFTGLRIALSFAKGLAFAGDLRLVGVPTLDALALGAGDWEGRLCAMLDARKQEIYVGLYAREHGRIVRLGDPLAVAARELAGRLDGPWTLVGDGVAAYGAVFTDLLGARATLRAPATHPPSAAAVARLAAARLARDPAGDDLATLAPVYIRPPEAELSQARHSPSEAPRATAFVDKVPLLY